MRSEVEAVKQEPQFAAFVSIEWGDKKHVWCWQAADSEKRESGELEHTPEKQRRSATDCERRCGRARFPSLRRTTPRRCRTSRHGRTTGTYAPACTATPLSSAARSKVRWNFA